MKRRLVFILSVVAFAVLFFTQADRAFAGFDGFFGGKIVSIESFPIKFKQWANYICFVNGTTISITPVGSMETPTSYLIPFGVSSKTDTFPEEGQWILGAYTGNTPTTCILKTEPYTTDIVWLPTITLFGNSGGFQSTQNPI